MQQNWTLSLDRPTSRHFIGVLTLILLVAAALRLWDLTGIPPGPHYDEAANGILAAEIAKGAKTPVFIPSYTGKEVLFFYLAAGAMRLLGIGLLALRLTSALTGLMTCAATVWLVYELFADDDPGAAFWMAALTSVLITTSFWHVLLSRVGFRAITQPLLQTLTLAALWRGLRRENLVWLFLGGLFCGLTGYTYLASRAFPIPLVISLFALLVIDVGRWRQRLIQFTGFGLSALASFAPLGLHFVRNPDAFTTRMRQVGPSDDWGAAVDGVVSAVKMFFVQGDPYIRFNLPLRPLFGPVIAVLLVVGLAVTVQRLFRPQAAGQSRALQRAREILLLVWMPAMLLPSALAVNEITPSNLRAIGLIPLVFVFPARGLWTLFIVTYRKSRISNLESRITRYLPIAAFGLLLLTTAVITARDYFVRYVSRADLYEVSDGDLADIAAYLNQTDLNGTTVYVGSIHYRHPTLAFLVKAYSEIKWLVGASTVVYPASGEALYLFPRSAKPDSDWLGRYLADAEPIKSSTASDGAPAFTGFHLTTSLPPSYEILANFSGIVRLQSYQVERAVSGDRTDVTVVYQILALPPYLGLTPFYHLEDPWGFRWGQAEPFQYAAEDWTPGEVVISRVQLPISPGAPPGDYILRAGLYSQSADTRLAVIDSDGRFAGTTVPLTLTVARAETPPNPDELEIRQRLDLETDDGLTLLGSSLDTTQARPGERINLTLFWQANPNNMVSPSNRRAEHTVNLFLQGVGGDDLSLYSDAPVHGTYNTSQWTEGEIILDRYNPRLPLAAVNASPGDYTLVLALTAPDGETLLGPTILGTLTLIATDRAFDVPAMHHMQRVSLADRIEFLGYDIEPTDARSGGTIHLILFWRVLDEMDTDYTVFSHVLGPDGSTVAQQDNPPVKGTYPTTLWLPGEVIADPYDILLSADLPPGDYPIEVGFYVAESGLRLADPIVLETVVTIRP